MGPDSGSTRAALEAARDGASIAIGPPGAYRPTIWLDDAAAAIAAALRAPDRRMTAAKRFAQARPRLLRLA